MKKLKLVGVLFAVLGFAGAVMAIQPPVVTQPKAGTVEITIGQPSAWNDDSTKGFTGRAYKLYLTNEAAPISVPASPIETKYIYVVPVGYTIKATDSVAATAVGNDGEEGPATPSTALPAGVNTPGPKPSAPGAITAARAPN